MKKSILDLPPPAPGLRIAYGPDPNQFGDLRLPSRPGPHPVVLFIHGGYWRAAYDLTHAGHLCVALTQAGYATWNIEYRRLGQKGGGWPGTQQDVLQGAEHLRLISQRYNLNLKRLVAAGHSAGGQLALWLGAQPFSDLAGVAALAAVSDLRQAFALKLSDQVIVQYLGGTPDQIPDRYARSSPIELVPIRVPQRILHGTADGVVPYAMSEKFCQKSKNAQLIPLEDSGHYELIDPRSKQWPVVLDQITNWKLPG